MRLAASRGRGIRAVASEDGQAVAIIAEKPSVARDIARVVGASRRGEGYLHGGGYIVTWAIGHLVRLAQPHEIRPEWKAWRRDLLPMLPAEWPLVVIDDTREQFEIVRRILNSPKVGKLVCATDAGREGELIFRYLYEAAGCSKPASRLWVSSLTADAIRAGLASMKDGSHYDPLADAARGRSRADWLVGMNLSRAYTLALGESFSVGRVQTPTLAMVVERELEIRAFVPLDYLEIEATFSTEASSQYKGTWFRQGPEPLAERMRLPLEGGQAEAILERARTGEARIESVKSETQRMAPPLLYDLTELQRHANRVYGFSAQKTLDLAQALYERHKLISYPRTDSRHLSAEVAKTLPRIVEAVRSPYADLLAPGTGETPLGRRFVDDAKVTDHHAIIPTHTRPNRAALSPDEEHVYDLVCRRVLSAWQPDYVTSVQTVITAITNPGAVDRYHSSGTSVQQAGWKALDVAPRKKREKAGDDEQPVLPSDLDEGALVRVLETAAEHKKTRPPKRFTEATLLTAMETAGKTLDEKEISDAMKDSGLGTPATRAAIIEVLLKRGYVERQGKSLAATEKGIQLIAVVHPEVKSPAMTGQWEAFLHRIHRGQGELPEFMGGIERYVTEVVAKMNSAARPPSAPAWARAAPASTAARPAMATPVEPAARQAIPAPAASPADGAAPPAIGAPQTCPVSPAATTPARVPSTTRAPVPPAAGAPAAPAVDLLALLRQGFGFESFRPNQEEVCRAAIRGEDALLVMPTGSGKSLCYQLPGLARGGTTLVISPLIALMEDQVVRLQERGFAAERIHSGRDRAASRQACLDYLNGALQFLFIAPERLRVAGFPEMLAKRQPALIAIDEAHCISQWGHDFRPDYRRIGGHLPALRPAPVMALTATATPLVQDDIVQQLGLEGPGRFIHGFRRDNIAIEVIEVAQSMRLAMVEEILGDSARRPAIVYTPTRRESEIVAASLGTRFPAAAYHAGMNAPSRDQVQTAFLAGRLEIIVATIAFGMGVDKPDIRTVVHTALPGSIESYYQEIGRAGRDGALSRAILMQSYSDRRTHDYFLGRDYPEPPLLDLIFAALTAEPQVEERVAERSRLDEETFASALEKLWIHGGVQIDELGDLTRGSEEWRESYESQREHKIAQLTEMLRFAECNQCRMVTLVRHFGDFEGARARCGICDFCAPKETVAQRYRPAAAHEQALAREALAALCRVTSISSGRLHAQVGGGLGARNEFERVLSGLARAGLVEMADASFEKDGRQIGYKLVRLSSAGRRLDPAAPLAFDLTGEIAAPARAGAKRRKSARAGPAPRPVAADRIERLESELRAWRLNEARRASVPAFRIFSDRVLRNLATQAPTGTDELLAVSGIGKRLVEKYGAEILRILKAPGRGE
ncbi:MAG: DNA topoisomerase 3 [Acidobacteria bacterium]|nr:DNA topoisomerase 3 [Acidobacteriota bacterium]